MISKSQISFITSLQQKKFRKLEQLFVAEGEKVVLDLFASALIVKKIFATDSFFLKHQDLKIDSASETFTVTETELKKISSLIAPNEVLVTAEIPVYNIAENELVNSLSLVLDDISDPGNLGTIIRIADWFGIKNIICSTDTADCYNPKVVQAAMGSLFRIKVHYTDLQLFLEKNNQDKKIPVYGTEKNGKNIYSAQLSTAGLIVMGSESKGIRDELKKYFNSSLCIPAFSSQEDLQAPDSLNVAVSTAIVCAEFRRR